MARRISTLGVIALLVAVAIANACLEWLGNWEEHEFGLTLTQRILWGVGLVALIALILTRVTIFGWSFRNYLRLDEATVPLPRRPTAAPWYKSGVTSFAITVFIVSLTGVVAIAIAVLWILEDVIGVDVFWLVFKILGISYWVLLIAAVLTRIILFGKQKYKDYDKGPEADT
jgi:hypothetical protein